MIQRLKNPNGFAIYFGKYRLMYFGGWIKWSTGKQYSYQVKIR